MIAKSKPFSFPSTPSETRPFCGCGLSRTFPFCDGKHTITKTHVAGKLSSCGAPTQLDPVDAPLQA
jgi:CDGSH-type Zn-finger protein